MLDTLLTVAMLSLPARPAVVRTPALVALATARPAVVRASVPSPELNTTCYLSTSESCWTER